MTSVKGRLWRIDADGFILNDADMAHVVPPYDAVAADVVAAYTNNIPHGLHSIYLTGSIPRGLAEIAVSDMDAFAVLQPDHTASEEWIPAAEKAIAAQHTCVSAVQMELWPYDHVFGAPNQFSIGAFIIKTHSVCVWGTDLAPELPGCHVGPAIANDDIVQIKPDIAEAAAAIKADTRPDNVRCWCKRIMKNILRAGFGLVMVDAGVHTRDLDLCYEHFARAYPGHSSDMRRVLDFARSPSGDAQEVLDFLNYMGAWIITHADRWLDRYNPRRDRALRLDESP